ncbi:MAG: tetratricopeptide repeat protein [Thermodesulfobacteriota bacterium]
MPSARRSSAVLWGMVGLLVGLLAGAVVGGVLEHRLGSRGVGDEPPSQTQQPGLSSEKRVAMEAIQERLLEDPKDADAWIRLGDMNYDLDRPFDAIQAYEKALEIRPWDPDVITDMGTMYRRIGRPQKAASLFRKANEIAPGHFQSLYNLGVVLLHDLQDNAGAVRAWEEYLKVGPQGPQSERIRGIVENLKAQKKGVRE